MHTATFVLGVGATLLSLPLSLASSVCSSAAYKGYLRLSSLPAAQSYCSSHYHVPTPTRTSTITTTVVSTITSTITPDPITVTTTDSFTTTFTESDGPVKRDVAKRTPVAVAAQHSSLFSKLKRQPMPFIKTVCSCIEHTPACKTKTVTRTAASTATVLVTLAPVVVTTATSTTTTTTTTISQPPPVSSSCSNYTASCFDVMNGILASNSIASPQLVDYRMQSAILGITSPSDFLAALGPDPCQTYTDPTEHDTCVALVANSDFVSQLTDITTGVLTAFQTCASDFAAGGTDYQVVINDPANASCGEPNSLRRHVRRVGEDHDLTSSMLEGIEDYMMTADAPVLGRMKSSSDLPQLLRRQQSTCARTGTCFETCPDCRDQQTYCGTQANIITTAVCGAVAAVANAGVQGLAAAACTAACAPLGPGAGGCGIFCARVAGGLSAVAVMGTCAELRSVICDPLTQRCANCNSANNGICDAGSTQCCAGETGTQCGADCCCCPQCQAPGGINCACTAAPC